MTLRDYEISSDIEASYDVPEDFYGVVMALMRGADSFNLARLKEAWPEIWNELQQRYMAPAGLLVGEKSLDGKLVRGDDGIVREIEA